MIRFLYGRLHSKDYDFFIPPKDRVGPLSDAIRGEFTEGRSRLIFLQSYQGKITFGIKERLTLKDEFNRPRRNFMGYQLEDGESAESVPFFDALSERFGKITEEALACHKRLDRRSGDGAAMQKTKIRFNRGCYREGNAWDEAVMTICRNPGRNLLMMFDDRGNALSLSPELTDFGRDSGPPQTERIPSSSADEPVITPSSHKRTPAHRPAVRTSEPESRTEHFRGIVSTVTLDESERAVLPPPMDFGEDDSYLKIKWRRIASFFKSERSWFRGAEEDDYTPDPP